MVVVVSVILIVAVAATVYFLFFRTTTPKSDALGETRRTARLEAAPSSIAEERATVGAKPLASERTSSNEKAAAKEALPSGLTSSEETPNGIVVRESAESRSAKPLESTTRSLAHIRDVEGLRKGLGKTRANEGFFGRLRSVFSGKREIDKDIAAQIEEVLLSSDVGVKATESLLRRVREQLQSDSLSSPEVVWATLREETLRILRVDGRAGAFELRNTPTVVLMVGVNGAGKTTTIGKLATRLKGEGRHVVLAAADTFRAAAVQQLIVWGNRVGVEVIKGKDGADPGSVIFEAVQRAKQIGADVVLADTAGRLHTKSNLMAELTRVVKTTGKALDGAPHEILLVLDSTNGQNALAQATEFQQALPLTGVVLTKLDGTAKGGVVIGICDTLKLPIRFVGLGETASDLHDFDPDDFVEALLGQEEGQS
jgi:fused signal recognition particle receptor